MKNVANENLSRRNFLRLAGICAASIPIYETCARQPAGSVSTQERPNIIFLMADDQRWDAMGCMGNPVINTPNMDRLASEGILFENAFLTTSICMASRAGIMLGQFESRHKCNFERPSNRTISYAEFDKSYPRLLQKAGYRTGFIGKFGFAVSRDKIRNCPLNPDGTRDGGKQLWKERRYMPADRFDVYACRQVRRMVRISRPGCVLPRRRRRQTFDTDHGRPCAGISSKLQAGTSFLSFN